MMGRNRQVKKWDADSVRIFRLDGTSYAELIVVDWEYMRACVCVCVCVCVCIHACMCVRRDG